MLDGDSSTARVVSSGVQVLAIVVLGLVAAAVVTTVTNRQRSALLLAETAAALATVVLVAVTGWFAARVATTVEESRQLRRRPYVKRIVVTGVDRVLAWLETGREKWAVDSPPSGMPVYPDLPEVTVPEDVVADIGRDYPDLVTDVSDLLTDAREYRQAWATLHADLADHIATEFTLDEPDDLRAALPETVADRDPTDVDLDRDPAAFVRDHPDLFARHVLENPPAGAVDTATLDTETCALLLLDARRSEFMNLRGADPVADQIDLVHRLLEDLTDGHEDVVDDLEAARAEYVDEYDFMETELAAVEDERSAL